MATSVPIKFNFQKATSFPNQNEKHIDYVICYEKLEDIKVEESKKEKIKIVRKAFFDALKANKMDIYEIEKKEEGEEAKIFCLLNCSTERLLEEAEITRLEMILKNVDKRFI